MVLNSRSIAGGPQTRAENQTGRGLARSGQSRQALPKLAIENQITKPLACDDIFQCLRHPHTEEVGGSKWISAVVD